MSTNERADEARREIPNHAGWATFEARIRGRRFARCLEQSRASIDLGRLDDAREALKEARTLCPDAPELSELERRIASQPGPGAVLLSSNPQTFEADPGWPRVLAGMAAVVVLFGLVGFSLMQVRHTGPARELLSLIPFGSAADEPAAMTSEPAPDTAEPAPPTSSEPAAPITGESRADATPTVKDVASEKRMPRQDRTSQPVNRRPAAASTAATHSGRPSPRFSDTRAPATTLAYNSREQRVLPQPPLAPAPSGLSLEEGRPPVEAVALAMTNGSSVPTSTTGSEPGIAAARALDVPVPASHTLSASDLRYEESLRIRAVLLRYENAYNRLDAKAASSVWPGVDQSALGRAFSGLLSQKVSLGLCDITVIGDIGGASCAGKARWEPKVGGGLQTADRHWNFQLRKTAEGWKIQQIQVQ